MMRFPAKSRMFAAGAVLAGLSPAACLAQEGIAEVQLYFELNATDGDVGLQGLIDADKWRTAKITGPGGTFEVIRAIGNADSSNYGTNEIFFESDEPTLDERPFSELLTLFPPGIYTFSVRTIANQALSTTAPLTADMPCPPVILAPVYSAGDLLVRWRLKPGVYDPDTGVCSTARRIKFDALTVSVELTDNVTGRVRVVDIDLPTTARAVEAPDQFLAGVDFATTDVKLSVKIVEAGGNRTLVELDADLQ